MEKLTKAERHDIYKCALELNADYDGYDFAFKYLCSLIGSDSRNKMHSFYPEIKMLDGKMDGFIWASERIKIRDLALMFCIEMTA